MNTARLLVPIFTLQDFLYLLLDFLLAGFHSHLTVLLQVFQLNPVLVHRKNCKL